MFVAEVIIIASFSALAAFAIFISVMVYFEHNKPRRWTYLMRADEIKSEDRHAQPCPMCGGLETEIVKFKARRVAIQCSNPQCGLRGPSRSCTAYSIIAWNTLARKDRA